MFALSAGATAAAGGTDAQLQQHYANDVVCEFAHVGLLSILFAGEQRAHYSVRSVMEINSVGVYPLFTQRCRRRSDDVNKRPALIIIKFIHHRVRRVNCSVLRIQHMQLV